MSKRLKYLTDARPEAATAYFEFLRESGRHLDDKTRFLISVVTKVAGGTPAGLRQYIPHAMRAGASAQEILDAVLMSFPAAGLPKVLDAIDVIMELDLPDFQIENLQNGPQWLEAGKLSDYEEKKLIAQDIKGFGILVYVEGKEVQVFDRRCPHLGTKLPSECKGDSLICPKHNWEFEIPSGEVIDGGTRGLHTIEHKIEGDSLLVRLIVYQE